MVFLLSPMSSRLSTICPSSALISSRISRRLASESFFCSRTSRCRATSRSSLAMRSMCFRTCSTFFSSSLGRAGTAGSPSAPSTTASSVSSTSASSSTSAPSAGTGSSPASLMISRTRILPFLSRSPRSWISRMASCEASTEVRTDFSPSSMRFAISTSPSRVRRETDPILRRYIRTGSLDLP